MAYKSWKCLLLCVICFGSGLLFTEQATLQGEPELVNSYENTTSTQAYGGKNCSPTDVGICFTKECTLTAAMLISAMDASVDPCNNFYDFTCANFIRTNPVPEDKDRSSSFLNFHLNLDLQLKNLMEGIGSLTGPKVTYAIQEIYHVCINTTYQREKELQAVGNFTQHILDWPLAWGKEWQPKYPTLGDYIALYEEKDYSNSWVNINVLQSDENNAPNVWIGYPSYDSAFRYALSSGDSESQEKFIKHLLHLLGNDDNETIHSDLQDIKQISTRNHSYFSPTEQSDANISDELKNILESEDDNITFRLLKKLTDGKIDWLSIVNRKMENKHAFTEDDYVTIEGTPNTFRMNFYFLTHLPLRIVMNVMGWKALKTFLPEIDNPDLEELLKESKMHIRYPGQDIEQPMPRWKRCLEQVNHIFSLGVTRMFLEKYIDRSEKESAKELVQFIQEAYIQNIRQSEWLDEGTKNSAIRKAKLIKQYIGFPDFIFDDDKLDKFYEKVPEVHSTHFKNYIEYYSYVRNIMRTGLSNNESEFEDWSFINPLEIGAFYKVTDNSIWLPFGILQLPFFQDKRLAALNFGMIGSVIGHEIGHAFDDTGREYNEDGDKKNWWSDDTEKIFREKGDCFQNQYNQFCPEELQAENESPICVNGERTLGENLADFTGLNAAYMAYKLWVEKHGEEKRLPGLYEFPPEQLFYMGYAYLHCENVPADKWMDLYEYNPHSPGRYRTLGALSNSRIFREAFQCPKGIMNKDDDSCSMW